MEPNWKDVATPPQLSDILRYLYSYSARGHRPDTLRCRGNNDLRTRDLLTSVCQLPW